MTTFEPTTRTIDPPLEADALGAAVVAALRRDLALKLTWPWWVTLVLGVATAGLAPLVVLLLRFRTFAVAQKFQFEHVTEWLELNGEGGEALATATRRLGGRWPAVVFAGLTLAAVAFALAAVHLWRGGPIFASLGSLYTIYLPLGMGPFYVVLLVAAFLGCHVLALHVFARRVRDYVDVLNERMKREGRELIRPPRCWVGASLRWIGAGTLLLLGGILWGLPMMLAGGAHKRYIKGTSADVRGAIADRIEIKMAGRQP